METNKILELFNKSEAKLKASFEQLPNASEEEQTQGVIQIQQSSYFLEKINQILFYKIIKDVETNVSELRKSLPILNKIEEPVIQNGQIEFTLNNQKLHAPILSIEKLSEIMKIKKDDFSGKYIQMGFLLRPENLFDVSLIVYLKENNNVIL